MATVYRNTKGRFRTPTAKERDVDIRTKEDAKKLDTMMKNGAPTFILIYADWCGHCHRYLPTWSQLENTPGRTANMARVHYDMQEQIPAIANAKIQGYPSVIKVMPDGRIQSYPTEGGAATNAMPNMRDEAEMAAELRGTSTPVTQMMGGYRSTKQRGGQYGGAVLEAFSMAIQQAGPAALLLLANSALSGHTNRKARTYRSPKRASRRASTRRSSRR